MSDTLLASAPVQTIPVGDSALGYRVVGAGPDVVFVHGWPLHGLTWRHIVERLAPHYRCHVFDLPGTGDSKWDWTLKFGIGAHATRVRAAVDALGLESFALVGHDSGAAITRHVAAELGDRVWANVVSGSEIPGHRPFLLQALLVLGKLPISPLAFRTLLRSRFLRSTQLGWGACFSDPSRAEGEFHGLFGAPLLASRTAFAGQMGLARDFDWADTDALAEAHTRITGPTLMLWGDGDPYFPVGKAKAMADQFAGGATLISRPDGRLFVHEEHPGWFAEHTVRHFEAALATNEAAAR